MYKTKLKWHPQIIKITYSIFCTFWMMGGEYWVIMFTSIRSLPLCALLYRETYFTTPCVKRTRKISITNTEDCLYQSYRWHRGTVGAWWNRGYLRVLLIFLSTSLQSCGLQDFLKRLLPKLSATRTLHLCRSLCLRHLREIVCFHLRVLSLSV